MPIKLILICLLNITIAEQYKTKNRNYEITMTELFIQTSDYLDRGIPGIRSSLKNYISTTLEWPRNKSKEMNSSDIRKMLVKIMNELKISSGLQSRLLTAVYKNSKIYEAEGLEAYYFEDSNLYSLLEESRELKDLTIYFYYKFLEKKGIKISDPKDLGGAGVFLQLVLSGLRHGCSSSTSSDFSYFGGGQDCIVTKKKILLKQTATAKAIVDAEKSCKPNQKESEKTDKENETTTTKEETPVGVTEDTVDSWEDLL